ncbi:alpha/beta hydrolase [Streptomyces sp. XH2]|uniref:alpha/beta hydrolase n=1 Tax=Streptomyces sp. XH2 TaxID=3412483 RepID=UPI003C7B1116
MDPGQEWESAKALTGSLLAKTELVEGYTEHSPYSHHLTAVCGTYGATHAYDRQLSANTWRYASAAAVLGLLVRRPPDALPAAAHRRHPAGTGRRGTDPCPLETAFRPFDGTALAGTVTVPEGLAGGLAVRVHGAGGTRNEGGFFSRIAAALAGAGVRCLRFDLRAHGVSGGRLRDITIAGVADDIRAACDHVRAGSGLDRPASVIAASFSGGAATLHAAHRPEGVGRLVLPRPAATSSSAAP